MKFHSQIAKSFPWIVQVCLLLFSLQVLGQISGQDTDDIFGELDKITKPTSNEVIAAFKSTRLVIGQSTERTRKNQLHFRVSHVFGKIVGISNFFGLDNLNNMNLSFEYGLTDYIQFGIARSNKPDKTYITSLKLSLLRQRTGNNAFPFSFSYFGGVDYKSRRYIPESRNKNFNGRLDYINQVLISRKFTKALSILLSPIWVHRNLTDNQIEPNDIYSIAAGGRYLFSRSTSINLEYYHTLSTFDVVDSKKNALSVGLDIETGGHVFQLYLTNVFALHPGKFAINQNGDFFKRNINFGFSLLRTFSL